MEQTRQLERYVFRKPLWQKVIPLLLLPLLWLLPAYLWKGHLLPTVGTPAEPILQKMDEWLASVGATLERVTIVAGVLSAILLFLLFWACEQLIVTPEAMIRRLPLGIRRSLRWVDVDEVLIDHVEARMEGDATAKKTLRLYEIPRGLLRRRRRMEIRNRQFDGYEDVERIAVQVSIPAVAARLRQRIEQDGKPAIFPVRERGEGLLVFLLFFGGLAALAASFYPPIWPTANTIPYIQFAPPVIALLSAIAVVVAIFKFFYKQIGVDAENIYILTRKWLRKKVPIDLIADIQIRDNQMRIFAFTKDPETPRQVFKSNRYIRNRGVLLRLIREEYENRRSFDATPIAPLRSIQADDNYSPGDEEPLR